MRTKSNAEVSNSQGMHKYNQSKKNFCKMIPDEIQIYAHNQMIARFSMILMAGILLMGDGALKQMCDGLPNKDAAIRSEVRNSSSDLVTWPLMSTVTYCFFRYFAKDLCTGINIRNNVSKQSN